MTKQDLINKVSDETGMPVLSVRPIVEATIAAIKTSVQQKEPVFIRGFGTFRAKMRAAKKARNITAGTSVIIAAHEVAHFKPSKSFTINK